MISFRMRGEGISLNFGGLGVEVCSLDMLVGNHTQPSACERCEVVIAVPVLSFPIVQRVVSDIGFAAMPFGTVTLEFHLRFLW